MGKMEKAKARVRSTFTKFRAKAFVVRTMEEQRDRSASGFEMHKVLGPFSLVMLGIGCIIGAGVFVLTGVAARKYAGPAVVVSYAISAITAMLTAFCYAEYAAELPVAGGAFNYVSMTFGEFVAWVTACDLILEYTLSAAAVAKGFTSYTAAFIGVDVSHLRFKASIFTLDLPAFAAVVAMSFILMRSTAGSSLFNNLVTGLNVILIIFVLAAGFPYVKAANYTPFVPFGLRGMFTGASVVFFSFIGFDTVATAAEEVKNPGKDLPIGIVGSLSICTVLYVLMCLVITGMQNYTEIDLDAPFAVAFTAVGLGWAQRVVAAGALTGIITSLLGSLLGQARIYVTLGRQALAPAWLARVHPVRGTPVNATLVTMITAGFLALFIDLELLAELVSIGTLMVFCFVCAGVLFRRYYVHGSGEPMRPVLGRLGAVVLASCGFSLSFTEEAPIVVPFLFLGAWLAITCSFFMLPVRYVPQVFRCPCSPFIPSLGMLFTLHLIGSLGWPAYVRWIVWFALGTTVYLCYGVHRSPADAAPPRTSDPGGIALQQSFIVHGSGDSGEAITSDDVVPSMLPPPYQRYHIAHTVRTPSHGAPATAASENTDLGNTQGSSSGGGGFAYGRPYGMPAGGVSALEVPCTTSVGPITAPASFSSQPGGTGDRLGLLGADTPRSDAAMSPRPWAATPTGRGVPPSGGSRNF